MTAPKCVYSLSDVTTHDQISHAFTLYICILQVIEVGTAWERGYNTGSGGMSSTSNGTAPIC